MKKSALLTVTVLATLLATPAQAQMSLYDYNRPIGWAIVDGEVTGSNNENPVRVTTLRELTDALEGSNRSTIYIDGTIDFDGLTTIKDASNKTVYGLPGARLVNPDTPSDGDESGILLFRDCDNIIIRNITFEASGAYDIDGNDNLCLQDCQRIWVDHCDFQDGVDGNFDCNHSSDYIAVTWCRFRYLKEPVGGGSGGSDDHRFSNLWGGDDGHDDSRGHLNTTFYACWWDEGCRERMPRVRFGKVHLLNCLYSSEVGNYCIGAGYLSNLYVERNAFVGDFNDIWRTNVSNSHPDYHITLTGNTGASDHQEGDGSDDYFIPSDYYGLEGMPIDNVEAEVGEYAGATLDVEYGEGVTSGISNVGTSAAEVTATEYYSPSGTRLAQPQKGINIVRHKMSDGTIRTRKIMY